MMLKVQIKYSSRSQCHDGMFKVILGSCEGHDVMCKVIIE